MWQTYTFTENLNERGIWSFSVYDADEREVYAYRFEGGEDESSIIEDGFMRHQSDFVGLAKYLTSLGILGKGDRIRGLTS